MDKLYYGSGVCTIETSQIVGLQISYRGKIKIDDKTSDSHQLMVNEKLIMIFPMSSINVLSELFEYSGEFRILSVVASDSASNKVPVQIKKQMHYFEMLDTNFEDFTQFPADFNKIPKNNKSINQKTILVGNGVHQLKKLTSNDIT